MVRILRPKKKAPPADSPANIPKSQCRVVSPVTGEPVSVAGGCESGGTGTDGVCGVEAGVFWIAGGVPGFLDGVLDGAV